MREMILEKVGVRPNILTLASTHQVSTIKVTGEGLESRPEEDDQDGMRITCSKSSHHENAIALIHKVGYLPLAPSHQVESVLFETWGLLKLRSRP